MATQAAVVARIFNYLYGSGHGKRPFGHRINEGSGYTAGDGVITVDDGTKFAVGDILEFQPVGMQARVESIATNDLSIEAGINGTTDANLTDNVVLYKNPRFTIQQAGEAISSVLEILEEFNIFIFGTGSITLVASQWYYDLTETDIIEAWGVLALYEIEDNTLVPKPLPFDFKTGLHTTVSATQHGIVAWYWGDSTSGDPLYYTYAQKLDNVTDLETRHEEMVVLGSVAQMMGADINPRTMDPGKRTDRTVQPGQSARDSRWFQAEFQRAAWREEARLMTVIDDLPRDRRTARVGRFVW